VAGKPHEVCLTDGLATLSQFCIYFKFIQKWTALPVDWANSATGDVQAELRQLASRAVKLMPACWIMQIIDADYNSELYCFFTKLLLMYKYYNEQLPFAPAEVS